MEALRAVKPSVIAEYNPYDRRPNEPSSPNKSRSFSSSKIRNEYQDEEQESSTITQNDHDDYPMDNQTDDYQSFSNSAELKPEQKGI